MRARGGGQCIGKPPVRVAAEQPAAAAATGPAPAQTASVSTSADGAAADRAASPATPTELTRGDAAATTNARNPPVLTAISRPMTPLPPPPSVVSRAPDAAPATDPQPAATADSLCEPPAAQSDEQRTPRSDENANVGDPEEQPAPTGGEDQERGDAARAAGVEDEGNRLASQSGDPVVQGAEDDLLSLWLIRGAGTSGDAAVAEQLFPEGSETLDDEQLRAVMREKLGTDMDPIRVRELLARLAGASGYEDSLVLSKEALNSWMRRRFPAFQIRQMLASCDLLSSVVEQMLPSSRARGDPPPDGLGHLKSLRKDDVRRALLASVDEWVDAIWAKVSHFQKAASGAQHGSGSGGGNLKFGGDLRSSDVVHEGNFGTSDTFDAGLEKIIGLPDPKVLDAIVYEHCNSSNSNLPFTTSNYHLTCTPKEELEAALYPDPQKTYPGAGDEDGQRQILPFRVYLSATCCLDTDKWENEELKEVLLKIESLCGSLELSERDKVHEAQVLLLMAVQGFAQTIEEVQRVLKEQGKPVTMVSFFDAVEEVRGWRPKITKHFMERGRELYRKANLRPEEVLAVHLYTGTPETLHPTS